MMDVLNANGIGRESTIRNVPTTSPVRLFSARRWIAFRS